MERHRPDRKLGKGFACAWLATAALCWHLLGWSSAETSMQPAKCAEGPLFSVDRARGGACRIQVAAFPCLDTGAPGWEMHTCAVIADEPAMVSRPCAEDEDDTAPEARSYTCGYDASTGEVSETRLFGRWDIMTAVVAAFLALGLLYALFDFLGRFSSPTADFIVSIILVAMLAVGIGFLVHAFTSIGINGTLNLSPAVCTEGNNATSVDGQPEWMAADNKHAFGGPICRVSVAVVLCADRGKAIRDVESCEDVNPDPFPASRGCRLNEWISRTPPPARQFLCRYHAASGTVSDRPNWRRRGGDGMVPESGTRMIFLTFLGTAMLLLMFLFLLFSPRMNSRPPLWCLKIHEEQTRRLFSFLSLALLICLAAVSLSPPFGYQPARGPGTKATVVALLALALAASLRLMLVPSTLLSGKVPEADDRGPKSAPSHGPQVVGRQAQTRHRSTPVGGSAV